MLAQQSFEAVALDGFPLLRGHLAHVYFHGDAPAAGDWIALRADMPVTLLGRQQVLPFWLTFEVQPSGPQDSGSDKLAVFRRVLYDEPVGMTELVEQAASPGLSFLAQIMPDGLGSQRVFVVTETEEPEL